MFKNMSFKKNQILSDSQFSHLHHSFETKAQFLERLNQNLKQVLDDPHFETIVYEPVLALKIMPKKMIKLFDNERYLMFTNKRLYTLVPKCYESERISRDDLVKNNIDLDYFSHIIVLPKDIESNPDFEDLYAKRWDLNTFDENLKERYQKKKVLIVIGFKDN